MPSRRDFLVSVAEAGAALSSLRLPLHLPVFGSRAPSPQAPAPSPQDVPIGLDWRMLGPFRGGPAAPAGGVPGRPDEFYFRHVKRRVWKTLDAGQTWFPHFSDHPVSSI